MLKALQKWLQATADNWAYICMLEAGYSPSEIEQLRAVCPRK